MIPVLVIGDSGAGDEYKTGHVFSLPRLCFAQIITSGTDRKVVYWECYDGSQIREVDGSISGSLNGMDISPKGDKLVTGGDDKLIKVG